jgi:hypothetical protein
MADPYLHPADEGEVAALIKKAAAEGRTVRVRGAGHSVPGAIAPPRASDASAKRTVEEERGGIHSRRAEDASAKRTVEEERGGIHSRRAEDASAKRTVEEERGGIHSRLAEDACDYWKQTTTNVSRATAPGVAENAFEQSGRPPCTDPVELISSRQSGVFTPSPSSPPKPAQLV